jgi:hypothetical protein
MPKFVPRPKPEPNVIPSDEDLAVEPQSVPPVPPAEPQPDADDDK